jgi:hypothetical protein
MITHEEMDVGRRFGELTCIFDGLGRLWAAIDQVPKKDEMHLRRAARAVVSVDLFDKITEQRVLAVNVTDCIDTHAIRRPICGFGYGPFREKLEHPQPIAKPGAHVKQLLARRGAAYAKAMGINMVIAGALLALSGGASDAVSTTAATAATANPDRLVADIGYRLSSDAGDLCPDKGPLLGLVIQDLSQFAGRDRVKAAREYGEGTAPQILAVARGSAAERAGLEVGDALLSADGEAMPAPPQGSATFARVSAILDLLERAAAYGHLNLIVRRADGEHAISIATEFGCRSRFLVDPSSKVNSAADGNYVEIDAGMVRFAGSEDQLAVIVAHELAHNILGHHARLAALRKRESEAGRSESKADAAAIRVTEDEADRLGIYLLDRAGYPPEAAATFWQRYAAERGHRRRDSTHAPPLQRVAVIQQEIARLRAMKVQDEMPHPQFWPRASGNAGR